MKKINKLSREVKKLQEPTIQLEEHVVVDIDGYTVTYTANGEEITESEYLRLKAIQKYGIEVVEWEIVD